MIITIVNYYFIYYQYQLLLLLTGSDDKNFKEKSICELNMK